ncbi:MAG: hypothetical protein MUE97_03430, partial [Phycisphaerales bacterium]|nr:hypothetical protein [Phycisphaerales bacterium]
GQFSAAPASSVQGQINSSGLIRLTGGQRWENPGSSFNDAVFAMTSFDDDGPGGSVPKLAVGGAFTSNNSATARLVAVWDGSTWGTFGDGLNPLESWPTPVRRVFAMTEFDEDGAGPLRPSLFVGGSMQGSFDGVVSPYVIRWRRDATTGVGTWLSVPLPPGTTTELGGNFCLNFCTTIPYEPVRLRVLCMASFDLDGTGPAPTELYIGGAINAPSTGGEGLMKWNPVTNTTAWVVGDSGRGFADAPSPWPGGVNLIPYSMRTTPPTPSVPGRLLISSVNTVQSVPVTCVSCPPAQGCPFSPINITTTLGGSPIQAFGIAGSGPAVTNQPDNTWVTLATSTSAGFAVTVSGSGPFTYQWRKDGVNLINGTSQGFGAVLGATGPATILGGTANPINLTSQGWYDVRVGNACGTGFSTRAWLVVQPDATPYFPIRFDAAVAPVTTPIGNATMSAIAGTTTPWPRFYSVVTSTPFAIAPTGNNTWRGRLAAGSPTGNRSVTIPVSRFGVGEVYTLLNTDGPSTTSVRFTFSATGGLSYTTTLAGGNQIRSFSHIFGPQSAASVDTSTVYDNGLLRMDKQRILLPNAFRSQTLTSITITDLGTDTTGRAILGGLTLRQRPLPCGPSDIAGENQTIGSDGATTADDIIVFLGWYFSGDLRADVAGPNQSTTPDGQFTADDIIVFLGRYFAGC